MSSRQSVLFLTNCEFGQSNVVLAVVYELLKKGEVDVHIASWTDLKPRVYQLHRQVFGLDETTRLTFHAIPGLGMFDSAFKNFNQPRDTLPHKPGFAGAMRLRELAPQMLAPWNKEEHIAMVDWFKELATTLQPAIVIIDPFLSPAHDMVRGSSWKYAVLSPCSLVAGLVPVEPWLAGFWKYPWQVKSCPNRLSRLLIMLCLEQYCNRLSIPAPLVKAAREHLLCLQWHFDADVSASHQGSYGCEKRTRH